MICQRSRGFYELHVALQLALVVATYSLHFFLIDKFYGDPAGQGRYIVYCLLMVSGVIWEAIHRAPGEWMDPFQWGFTQRHRQALRQTLHAAGPVVFFLVLAKDQTISRLFFFSFLPGLYCVLLLSSRWVAQVVSKLTFEKGRRERTLLVGSSRKILALQSWVQRKARFGLEVVGALCDEKLQEVGGVKVLGKVDHLANVVREHEVSQVIVSELPSFSVFLGKLAEACESLGVRLFVMSDLEEKFRHRVVYLENDGQHFFGLRQEPLENPLNRALKRGLDVAVALPVVVLILPWISLLVWCLQRRQSPGPLFFLQERRGFQNHPFRIIKFRTMHPDNPDATRAASANDSRIYPAGSWLRKLSLDELPQFLNVLRGEMSVVGPRPHLREHDEQFAAVMKNYHVRHWVKPGISGLAQVRGFRGEAGDPAKVRQRVESDIYYLENWSMAVDLMILVRTVWQMMFPPKTAY